MSKSTWSSKKFKGETFEDCDKKALSWFAQTCKEPSLQWDGLELVRVDIPAVAEKVTRLKDNDKQNGDMDWQT